MALVERPTATAFNALATAEEPNAEAFSAVALVERPTATAFNALATAEEPTAEAFSAVALDRRPNAREVEPVATDASPIATLMLVAVAPLPPPIAMEYTSAVASATELVPAAVPLPTAPFCIAVAAMEIADVVPTTTPTISEIARNLPLDGPLLVFLNANSEATTQQPSAEFQTIENILFIFYLACASLQLLL